MVLDLICWAFSLVSPHLVTTGKNGRNCKNREYNNNQEGNNYFLQSSLLILLQDSTIYRLLLLRSSSSSRTQPQLLVTLITVRTRDLP